MSEASSVRSDIVWVATGQALSALAMLGMMKVWAVFLDPAELGLMALVVGVPSILVGIILQPLFQAILVGYAAHAHQGNACTYRKVSGHLVTSRVLRIAVIIVAVGFPVTWLFDLHWIIPVLIIGLFIAEAVCIFEQMLFAAVRRQREVAIIVAGNVFFRLLFVWLFLFFHEASAYSAMIGNLVGAFLFVAFMRLRLQLEAFSATQQVLDSLSDAIEKEISTIAKPLMPSMVLANLTEMGNRYFIGATLGFHAAGLFVAAYGFVKRPYGMLNNVGEMTMTPILKSAINSGNSKLIAQTRLHWIAFTTVLSILGATLFYLFREPLVSIFLSNKYASISDMLAGLAVSIAFYNIANVFNWFSITLGDSRAVLINNIVGSTLTVILTIVLCLTTGLVGAIWALFIGYGIQLLVSVLTYRANLHRYRLAET